MIMKTEEYVSLALAGLSAYISNIDQRSYSNIDIIMEELHSWPNLQQPRSYRRQITASADVTAEGRWGIHTVEFIMEPKWMRFASFIKWVNIAGDTHRETRCEVIIDPATEPKVTGIAQNWVNDIRDLATNPSSQFSVGNFAPDEQLQTTKLDGIETGTWREICRTWRKPSFEEMQCWIVSGFYQYPAHGTRQLLHLKVEEWDWHGMSCDTDPDGFSYKARKEYPDYQPVECDIPVEEFTTIYSAIQRARIPLFNISDVSGLDGTSYGIYFNESSATLMLKWWCEYPFEWRGLTSAVSTLQEFLSEHVAARRKQCAK